jgi:hypothetical protein
VPCPTFAKAGQLVEELSHYAPGRLTAVELCAAEAVDLVSGQPQLPVGGHHGGVAARIGASVGGVMLGAVEWAERRNDKATAPHVELSPHSRFEMPLSARPALGAAHGLR